MAIRGTMGCVLLLVTASAGCLRAGAGPVRLIPGAERVEVVRDPAIVEVCVPITEIQISDGIIRRDRSRAHEGYLVRAHTRLRNVAAHEGGDTVLITRESSRVIPDPPTFKWTIDAVVYQCAAAGADSNSAGSGTIGGRR